MSWQAAALFGMAALILLGLLAYWAIWMTEGAYLGARAVRWLYDRGARDYDAIKQYEPLDEAAFLANPLFSRLEEAVGPQSLLLDVATGTARLPLALLAIPFYQGEIVGVDLSRAMLHEAARKSAPHRARLALLHHPAAPLPFADATFDGVTSLEALEFMPDRHAALREMVRVLRPGGWLLITNRIGRDARFLPGRADDPAALERFLASLGLVEIFTRPWQTYYDLIFARQPGEPSPRPDLAWQAALRCPHCATIGSGQRVAAAWRCDGCAGTIPIAPDGVWELPFTP